MVTPFHNSVKVDYLAMFSFPSQMSLFPPRPEPDISSVRLGVLVKTIAVA
jgi:hypothetical protein